MTDQEETVLSVKGLTKSFSGTKALDNVQFDLRKGEIHALMGENGAGKSTFMKILAGISHPDGGQITLDGGIIPERHRQAILRRNVAMVHQEILMVPNLTVAQNVFLGREKAASGGRGIWLNETEIYHRTAELLRRMEIQISPGTPVKNLSVAEMQMIEIAKAVSNQARVIIMDEPTSALSEKETSVLFRAIDRLKKEGVSIIYVSHKIEEIFSLSDRITILRDGVCMGTHYTGNLTRKELIEQMVGREIGDLYPKGSATGPDVCFSVKGLTSQGRFSGITFDVYAGEVLGVAGLMGAGRTEMARAIFGLDAFDSGEIFVKNKKVDIRSPQDAIRHGIGYISEDRKGSGFIPDMSVKHNLTLTGISSCIKGLFLNKNLENDIADRLKKELRIKADSRDQKVRELSGGNQQKVVIGKVLLPAPDLVIMDEPTRGIDVGAKAEIYRLIRELTRKGTAVIMISSELPEVLGMSDRIMVLSRGIQKAMLRSDEATPQIIMNYAVH